MKYLDETITAGKSFSSDMPQGLYNYRVVRLNPGNSTLGTNNYTTIFVGSFYQATVTRTFLIDISEIIRNDAWIPNINSIYQSTEGLASSIYLLNNYYVFFYTDSTTYVTSDVIQVAKIYRYPHNIGDMQNNVFFDFVSQSTGLSFPLQGRYEDGVFYKYRLTPRYPYKATNNYRVLFTSESGSSLSYRYAYFVGGIYGSSRTFGLSFPTSISSYKLSTIVNSTYPSNLIFGEYTDSYEAAGLFSFTYDSDYIEIYSSVQGCKMNIVATENFPNSTEIVKYYLPMDNWINYGTPLNLTIESAADREEFILKLDSGNIFLVFSDTDGDLDYIESYDFVRVRANIEGEESYLINGGFTIAADFYEAGQDEYSVDEFKIIGQVKDEPGYMRADNKHYIAQFDVKCYSKFYLQWQDRMGGILSQPFNEHYTYSEKVTTLTITNRTGQKRVSNIEIQPKFKINTGWLSDDLYPYYESIFTSPFLILYDTDTDTRYNVLVSDSDYTEKTYDNQQRKMFNLQLNLELDKNQTIIY